MMMKLIVERRKESMTDDAKEPNPPKPPNPGPPEPQGFSMSPAMARNGMTAERRNSTMPTTRRDTPSQRRRRPERPNKVPRDDGTLRNPSILDAFRESTPSGRRILRWNPATAREGCRGRDSNP